MKTNTDKQMTGSDQNHVMPRLPEFVFGSKGAAVKRILVACEESQAVTKAFRELGYEAWSCDILPCSGGHPEWHIQTDVFVTMLLEWDMVIAFPPCTDLAVSGARYFEQKKKDGRQQKSIDFFMRFTDLKCKWAIENPIGIMSSHYRKPDQIIQPWQFGHGETKATCLWLNGLPKLIPTNIVDGREQKIYRMPPSKDRAKLRSKTYKGIAQAIAEQWGKLLQPKSILTDGTVRHT